MENRMRASLRFAAICFLVTPAFALDNSDSKPPRLPIEGRNGSFFRTIALDIPAFRDLQPDLKLVYDSSSGVLAMSSVGSELGVGWSLRGVSVIQRVSGT